MFKFHFLSYTNRITGNKELTLPSSIKEFGKALLYLYSTFPKIRPYLDESPQELILLMDEMTIPAEKDSTRLITADIYVSPIIGGGC